MRKLPFKPTALRKRSAPPPTQSDEVQDGEGGGGDGLSMFRRAKEMAPILAADREREIKRKQRHKEQKETEQRRRSSDDKTLHGYVTQAEKSEDSDILIEEETGRPPQPSTTETANAEIEDELVTPPPSKRTRTSPTSARPGSSRRLSDTPSRRRACPTSHRDNISGRRTQNSVLSPGAPVISLDSDSEEDRVVPSPAAPTSRDVVAIDVDVNDATDATEASQPHSSQQTESRAAEEEEEEEEEFAEYIRKAEEASRDSQVAAGVSILITSSIEGSKHCYFKLRTDQPFAKIRTAWLAFQAKWGQITPGDTADIILTWRRNRVYAYSTLHSLGIRPYGDRVVTETSSRKGLNPDGTKVHMEMWTLDAFKQWEEEEERRRKVEAGELSEEDEAGQPEEPEVKLKVILKARDLEEVGLTVRPGTTVETLVTGFKARRELGPDKDVTLWFDGEKMEEHITIEKAEIDDMDTIEVHIK